MAEVALTLNRFLEVRMKRLQNTKKTFNGYSEQQNRFGKTNGI